MALLSRPRLVLLVSIAAATLSLAACETPTTYHPAVGHGFNREGFSEQRIEPDRYQISFAGNDVTSRDRVERYLLYRAAELTVQNGYDYFTLVDRNTERKTRSYVDDPLRPGPWGYWGVTWRYHRPGFGWGFYDPFWDRGPFGDDFDIQTIDKYEAHAEIVMAHGAPPAGDAHTFDAHQVIANLGPTIQMPGQQGNRPPPQ